MNRPVVIVDYNPAWPVQFKRISDQLADSLKGIDVHIEHIGSTAVRHLASKNILDIIVVHESRGDFSRMRDRLKQVGFEHVGNQGIEGREVFKLIDSPPRFADGTEWPAVHLYACLTADHSLERMIAFRNLLRSDPRLRDRYGSLKRGLAAHFGNDREGYTNAKTSFIESALANRGRD